MSAHFAIDPLDFVRNTSALYGKIAVAKLVRLQNSLFNNQNELEYTIAGALDRDDRPIIQVTVKGIINLQCQRCLGELEYALNLLACLLVVRNEDELLHLDKDLSVEGVLAVPDVNILTLIEDEIILSLPISPRHQENECSTNKPTDDSSTNTKNFFAKLTTLKKLH